MSTLFVWPSFLPRFDLVWSSVLSGSLSRKDSHGATHLALAVRFFRSRTDRSAHALEEVVVSRTSRVLGVLEATPPLVEQSVSDTCQYVIHASPRSSSR